MATTSEKVSAAFIGFFTFVGTALAILLLLFLLMSTTLVDGKAAPWLQPFVSGIIVAAPVIGTGVGVLVAWRYLHAQQAKREKSMS